MSRLAPTLLAAVLALPVLAVQAQPAITVAQAAAPAPTDGEVRKVDREAGKVTLKHGEIRHLDMPPMTMVFGVRDKALLDGLQVGDKVRFVAVHERGVYTVTSLQPAR